MRRSVAALLVTAAVPALIVVPTVGGAAAAPHPVTPGLTTVALRGVDPGAWAAERTHPAPADELARHRAGDAPEILTGRLATASYSLVGVTWDSDQPIPVSPEDLVVTVRTRSGGSWQPWTALPTDSDDRPAEGEGVQPVEGAADGVGRPARVGSSPYFAGPSDGVQVRVDALRGRLPLGLRVDLVDPGASDADRRLVATSPSAAQAAEGMPSVVTRSQWGADEALRNAAPTYEPRVRVAFVHHTATSNSYTKDQAAAAVRSIYAYDTNSLGWSDIAYNVLVDKYGQVFEGRYGGLDRAVRSGATGGFNAESWAVSALGNYATAEPSSALISSISKVLAWKLGIEHLDPSGKASLTAANGAGTTAKYSDGTKVSFNVISGHRDAGSTACPGEKLFAKLPAIRTSVESLMGAQLYATSATPLVVLKGTTTPVTVGASTMTAQQWRLEVKKQGAGTVLRAFSGSVTQDGRIQASWDLKDSAGDLVPAGVYTVTLQSWNGASVAVPYAVNVRLFADPDLYDRPADGVFRLEGRGYGHGHGMSQFGAEGAARQGLTAREILAFYYPGTSVAQAPASQTIRIGLSQGVRPTATGPDIRLRAAAGLQVSEGATTRILPTTLAGKNVTAWRTKLSAGTLGLYGWTGAAYEPLTGWTGRAGPLRFTTAPDAPTTSRVTLLRNGGGNVVYRGVIEARLSAAKDKLYAISAVLLDDYVKSVVSAEVPAGWSPAAYQAQAIAARSYGLFKRAAAVAAGSAWHICDSTTCQVYNGYSGETSAESKAATATAGQYLSYAGAPIFAEFSSANGGWSSDGGKPYLVAKADPYDGVVTGTANWGHLWTKDVSAATFQAAYPTLGSLQRIVVVDRVGQGAWGGRVTKVRLEGSKADVTLSGTSLRSALGLKSEWFRGQLVPPAAPPVVIPTAPPVTGAAPSAVRTIRVSAADRSAGLTWVAPTSAGGTAIAGYRVVVSPGGRVVSLPAAARTATVDGLVNGRAYTFAVTARNASGSSRAATAVATPTSAFGYQVDLPVQPVWRGALPGATDRSVKVLGVAGVPTKSVSAVALRVTATSSSARAGSVRVGPTGVKPTIAQQSVPAGSSSVNVVLVRPGSGGTITLRSTRDVQLSVDVVGYQTTSGAVGRRLIAVTPTWVASGPVSSSVPLTALVAGKAGVLAGAPAVLLQVTVSAGVTGTSVRLSPDGSTTRAVQAVTVPAGRTRTVPVVAPLGSDGSVRVLASGMGASVSLDVQGYYVADDGLASGGRTRALSPTRIFSSARTSAVQPKAGSTLTVPVLGLGGVPTTGVSAVVLNVIASTPTASGSLRVFPSGAATTSTHSLSYDLGSTVRTTVVVRVGTDGAVQVFLPYGGTGVVVDVAGYVTS